MYSPISHPDLFTQAETKLIQRATAVLEKKLFSANGPSLNSPNYVRDYLKLKISRIDREVFVALFLNTQNEVLSFEVLFEGSSAETRIYERVLVTRSLLNHATKVILAHNHPSGCREPSTSDHIVTRDLKVLLKKFEIELLDHFVIGSGTPYSFAEHGLL